LDLGLGEGEAGRADRKDETAHGNSHFVLDIVLDIQIVKRKNRHIPNTGRIGWPV
jgi:hypothetical protein